MGRVAPPAMTATSYLIVDESTTAAVDAAVRDLALIGLDQDRRLFRQRGSGGVEGRPRERWRQFPG